MKRFALVALLAALIFSVVSSASATELKVKGQFDVYGLWSANLKDHDSDVKDGDNYLTTQRMRTYFSFVTNENLKAVLGLEIDNIWGQAGSKGSNAGWGSDGTNIEVKHAYLDFNFPDSAVNVKAGLQSVALPGVFGNPIFDDDAAALVVSAPINDMVGVAVGYTRGSDDSSNFDNSPLSDGEDKDDVDMAFIAVPVTLDGFAATPYFAYAWMGGGDGYSYTQATENTEDFVIDTDGDGVGDDTISMGDGTYTYTTVDVAAGDDATVWALGINAELTMFDPLTFAADLIYASMDQDDFETDGWYAALAATYKFDFMTATLLGTYATGADGDGDESYMPVLREGWGVTAYVGGSRAFGNHDSWGTDALSIFGPIDLSSGVGLWTVGLVLDKISFVENLSHTFVLAYGQGTSDKWEDTGMLFTEEDSLWEVYLCNKYMIYENLAAINELGYMKATSELYDTINGEDLDASYFATVGFQYKF